MTSGMLAMNALRVEVADNPSALPVYCTTKPIATAMSPNRVKIVVRVDVIVFGFVVALTMLVIRKRMVVVGLVVLVVLVVL